MKYNIGYILSCLLILTPIFSQNTIIQQTTFSNSAINSINENSRLVATVGQVFTETLETNTTILASGIWGSVAQTILTLEETLPLEFSISNGYPNPFNPTVNIDITFPQKSDIDIKIYDLLGKLVFSHNQQFPSAGQYQFQWNAITNLGKPIASGVYLFTLGYKKNIYKQKITFLK